MPLKKQRYRGDSSGYPATGAASEGSAAQPWFKQTMVKASLMVSISGSLLLPSGARMPAVMQAVAVLFARSKSGNWVRRYLHCMRTPNTSAATFQRIGRGAKHSPKQGAYVFAGTAGAVAVLRCCCMTADSFSATIRSSALPVKRKGLPDKMHSQA